MDTGTGTHQRGRGAGQGVARNTRGAAPLRGGTTKEPATVHVSVKCNSKCPLLLPYMVCLRSGEQYACPFNLYERTRPVMHQANCRERLKRWLVNVPPACSNRERLAVAATVWGNCMGTHDHGTGRYVSQRPRSVQFKGSAPQWAGTSGAHYRVTTAAMAGKIPVLHATPEPWQGEHFQRQQHALTRRQHFLVYPQALHKCNRTSNTRSPAQQQTLSQGDYCHTGGERYLARVLPVTVCSGNWQSPTPYCYDR